MMRHRVAPNAPRTATSRRWFDARARNMFAMLEQAIKSTNPTAASKTSKVGRTLPTRKSSSGVNDTVQPKFVDGYSFSIVLAIDDISDLAWAKLTPGRSRATALKPG